MTILYFMFQSNAGCTDAEINGNVLMNMDVSFHSTVPSTDKKILFVSVTNSYVTVCTIHFCNNSKLKENT